MIDRRTFMSTLAGRRLAVPLAARAQKPAIPVIGFLCSASPTPWAPYLAGFRKGLNETGYVEGTNVAIEYRWAEGRFDRLPELAKDLLRRGIDVLIATGGEPSAFAAKAATATVPIVFSVGGDPATIGLVESLSRPGGNLTGVSIFTLLLEGKRIGLLHEAIPFATTIAILINPTGRYANALLKDAEEGARRMGVRLIPISAETEGDFEPAFAMLVQRRADALVVSNDPFFNNPVQGPCHLRIQGVCRRRRTHELRHQPCRCVSTDRRLHGPHPQRRQAWRFARAPADALRIGVQSKDREGDGHFDPAVGA